MAWQLAMVQNFCLLQICKGQNSLFRLTLTDKTALPDPTGFIHFNYLFVQWMSVFEHKANDLSLI